MHATIALSMRTCVQLTTDAPNARGALTLQIDDLQSGKRAYYGPEDALPWGELARNYVRRKFGVLDETGQALARRWGLAECPSCAGIGRIALGLPSGQRSDWPLDDPACDSCGGSGVVG